MTKTPAQKILRRPIAEWPMAIPVGKEQEIERELAALIQRAALLHSYTARRFNTGCGDLGHAASAKAANDCLVKIRRALGFSCPKNVPFCIQTMQSQHNIRP